MNQNSSPNFAQILHQYGISVTSGKERGEMAAFSGQQFPYI